MTWEDVESTARLQARRMHWSSPDAEPPRFLERLVRRIFRLPASRSVAHEAASRLVMVVPTSGGTTASGWDETFGWAVRLLGNGNLEYLRWKAYGKPDWDAEFPFEEHQLEPLTPGADHWGPLDAGQRLKTDLDWSPEGAVTVHREDGTTSWVVSPSRPAGAATNLGSGMMRALDAMRRDDGTTRHLRTAEVHSITG